ncbi:hypothetical protein FRC0485_00036 [Corynebacterium diphtheriae]|nr:hypothetical protein FRC0485_00036 [Corynebacterium diphtheriae]
MTFVASTHVTKRPRYIDSGRVPISCHRTSWHPVATPPRIMETTGQVSHTGTSDYPHYRGYSQGNGRCLSRLGFGRIRFRMIVIVAGLVFDRRDVVDGAVEVFVEVFGCCTSYEVPQVLFRFETTYGAQPTPMPRLPQHRLPHQTHDSGIHTLNPHTCNLRTSKIEKRKKPKATPSFEFVTSGRCSS